MKVSDFLRHRSIAWLIAIAVPILVSTWTLVLHRSIPNSLLTFLVLSAAWLYFKLVPTDRDLETAILDLPKLSIDPLLTKAEEVELRACFPWNVFYLQSVEYRQGAVICYGQLRYNPDPKNQLKKHKSSPTTAAYEIIKTKVHAAFADRFLLLLQSQPEDPDQSETEAASEPKYFFAIVPNSDPALTSASSNLVPHLILAVAATLTTLWLGIRIAQPSLSELSWAGITSGWQSGLIYLTAAVAIVTAREIARRIVAAHYQVKLTPPLILPFFPALGTLGALSFVRSPVPHRRALFDLAIAPTIAGLILALPILVGGLVLSPSLPVVIVPDSIDSFLPFDPKISISIALVAQIVTLGRFSNSSIDLHPLAAAGWLGLVITAVGLMPVGNLEGGQFVHAIFGQKLAVSVGKVSRLLLLMLAFLIQPWLLSIALGLFLLRSHRQATLDEVTELGMSRDIIGLVMLVLMLAIVLPVPKFLMPLLSLN